MNNMEKVAEMLGVKLGERFKINGKVFWLDKDGMWNDKEGRCAGILNSLLTGEYTIEKLPWKPQYSDRYWVIFMNEHVVRHYWSDDHIDFALYYAGNCFETKEEAEAQHRKSSKSCGGSMRRGKHWE